jgi:rod shape-determining protein MreC
MLILDERSSVSAIIQRTREHGIVQGRLTDTLRMKYLSGKTEVIRGDIVRSSGLGGVYPKGVLIGTVANVERADYGLTMSAEVLPAVDFSRLENVLVILD